MSTLASHFVPATGDGTSKSEDLAELHSEYPALGACLCGEAGERGEEGVPKCSVILFEESGKLKFCLSPKKGSRVAFGVLDDTSKLLRCLEACLAEGRFEWKPRRDKRS